MPEQHRGSGRTGRCREAPRLTELSTARPVALATASIAGFLFFGGKKLPGLARSLGKAQKEFKEGQNEDIQENEDNE